MPLHYIGQSIDLHIELHTEMEQDIVTITTTTTTIITIHCLVWRCEHCGTSVQNVHECQGWVGGGCDTSATAFCNVRLICRFSWTAILSAANLSLPYSSLSLPPSLSPFWQQPIPRSINLSLGEQRKICEYEYDMTTMLPCKNDPGDIQVISLFPNPSRLHNHFQPRLDSLLPASTVEENRGVVVGWQGGKRGVSRKTHDLACFS